MNRKPSRRALLAGALGLAGSAALRSAVAASPTGLPLAGDLCRPPAAPTPAQTEGPFFKPRTPMKHDFRTGDGPGRAFDLVATLHDRDCRPLAGAAVELWHADDDGRYDDAGFRFRGHQVTDAEGRVGFRTIVPGLYTGRTRHFHLILAPVGSRAARPLTTQLYFPDEPGNARDRLFDAGLLMRLEPQGEGLLGRYGFVLS